MEETITPTTDSLHGGVETEGRKAGHRSALLKAVHRRV